MSSHISFVTSIYKFSFEEKVERIAEWVLQYPSHQQSEILQLFSLLFEPQITLTWTFGRKQDGEAMHVEVMEDNHFLKMYGSDFKKVAQMYKHMRVFPTFQIWKCWYDRIETTRLLLHKYNVHMHRFEIFPNHASYMKGLAYIDKQIRKTEYGVYKLKQLIKYEIQSIVHRVKCLYKIRYNWAALKIQKAYRMQICMHCNCRYYNGIGPFCSKKCVQYDNYY